MEPEKGHGWKRKNIYKIPIVGFHVNICPGCIWLVVNVFRLRCTQAEFARSEHPILRHNNYPKFNKDRKRGFQCLATIIFREQVVVLGTVVFSSALFGIPHCPVFFAGENRNSLPCCGVDWVMVIQPFRPYIYRNPKHLNISP